MVASLSGSTAAGALNLLKNLPLKVTFTLKPWQAGECLVCIFNEGSGGVQQPSAQGHYRKQWMFV